MFSSIIIVFTSFQIVSIIVLGCEFFYVKHLREPLKRIDPEGACGLISMVILLYIKNILFLLFTGSGQVSNSTRSSGKSEWMEKTSRISSPFKSEEITHEVIYSLYFLSNLLKIVNKNVLISEQFHLLLVSPLKFLLNVIHPVSMLNPPSDNVHSCLYSNFPLYPLSLHWHVCFSLMPQSNCSCRMQ